MNNAQPRQYSQMTIGTRTGQPTTYLIPPEAKRREGETLTGFVRRVGTVAQPVNQPATR